MPSGALKKTRNRDVIEVCLSEGCVPSSASGTLIFYKQAAATHHRTVVLRIIHQQRNLPALTYYDDLDGLS